MGGCLKGCLGRLVALVVLVAAALVAWPYLSDDVPEPVERLVARVAGVVGVGGPDAGEPEPEPAASPELAEATLDRVERFRRASSPDAQLLLGDAEVSSVVRYALPGILPAGVTEPSVKMEGGRIFLSARVAVSAFPDLPSLEEVGRLLPDTVPIRMAGSLGPRDESTATLYVDAVQAVHIKLPDRFIPEILTALGREDLEGLPPNAMLVPLPQGLRAAYVRRDSLVLVADG